MRKLAVGLVMALMLLGCEDADNGADRTAPVLRPFLTEPEATQTALARATQTPSSGDGSCAELEESLRTETPAAVATVLRALCYERETIDLQGVQTLIASFPTVPPLTATTEAEICATSEAAYKTATPNPQTTFEPGGIVCFTLRPFEEGIDPEFRR
jgi:hypothetical protein